MQPLRVTHTDKVKSKVGGRSRKGRNVNGILLLNKAAEITSNGALQEAKRLFKAAKAGHTGSLDPLATGVLPLCFGEATKFSQFLLEANKRYLTTFRLGISTTTGDTEGEVRETRELKKFSTGDIEAVLDQYRGEITQLPSMYSAIKVNGEPLYKLARQGIEVERKTRQVTIFNMTMVKWQAPDLVLDISCSKGTYVRSLAEDIGEELGCGAHVFELKRLEAGPFNLEDTYSMDKLIEIYHAEGLQGLDKCLLPASTAVQGWPVVELTEITASYLRQGQAVQVSHAPTEGWVSIFSEAGDTEEPGERQQPGEGIFIGVGQILGDGRIAPRRLVTLA